MADPPQEGKGGCTRLSYTWLPETDILNRPITRAPAYDNILRQQSLFLTNPAQNSKLPDIADHYRKRPKMAPVVDLNAD